MGVGTMLTAAARIMICDLQIQPGQLANDLLIGKFCSPIIHFYSTEHFLSDSANTKPSHDLNHQLHLLHSFLQLKSRSYADIVSYMALRGVTVDWRIRFLLNWGLEGGWIIAYFTQLPK